MFRTHRVIVAATVIAWAGTLVLMFVPLVATGNTRSLLILAAVNMGAIAACLTMLAVLPSLLREMFEVSVGDYVAAYMAGLVRGQEVEPPEPARLRLVDAGQ